MKNLIALFCFSVINCFIFCQKDFSGFPFQFQTSTIKNDQISLEVLIIDFSNDTLWHESHANIDVEKFVGVFNLGKGNYINGQNTSFNKLNFVDADKILIYNSNPTSKKLILNSKLYPLAYSFHSKWSNQKLKIIQLSDIQNAPLLSNHLLKWNGVFFELNYDYVKDSSNYSLIIEHSIYSDTAYFGYTNLKYIDSTFFSYKTDSSNISRHSENSKHAHTTQFSDSAKFTNFAINNWSLNGDTSISNKFIGTIDSTHLILKTKGLDQFIISATGNISNKSNNSSNIMLESSFLANNSIPSTSINTTNPFLFFSGGDSYFIGGSNTNSFSSDTTYYKNSFSWGENNLVQGEYSSIFGKDNIIKPSKYNSSLDGSGSFTFGKNNIIANHSFAFGENSEADYKRNIALGKNAKASIASASVAIGTNAIATGATALSIGNKSIASGIYSTAIGNNCSSNGFTGSLIISDNSTNSIVKNTLNYQFMVRAAGGTVFYTSPNLSSGVTLAANGSGWNLLSDQNTKQNIELINKRTFLSKLNKLEISSWNYIGHNTQHIGPMAQDLFNYFNVGEDKKLINMIDADGIVLYSISSVYSDLKQNLVKTEDLNKVYNNIDNEKKEIEKLRSRLKIIENKIKNE